MSAVYAEAVNLRRSPLWQLTAEGVVGSVALVAVATVVAFAVQAVVAVDVVSVFFAAIVVAAVRFSGAASLVASALSVAAFDFFFVEPTLTFSVKEGRFIITFAMMFVVGGLIAVLTERLRRQEQEAGDAALVVERERLRSTLLSAVSHDLRSPLATITGAATMLRDSHGRLPDDERDGLLQAIADEGFHLERLVTSLLDMTRLEAGLTVKKEWVPVDEVVGAALARVDERLLGRAITTRLPDEMLQVQADPVLLQQVLVNLLENAARHTPPKTPIDIVVDKDGGDVVFRVKDRGNGVAAGVDVFGKFVRGKDAGPGGAGLGLAIVKGLVVAHGGSVDVVARAGGGAEFVVRLPSLRPPTPEVPR